MQMDSVLFYISGVGLGFATAVLTSMIDFALDLGHLFGGIRYNKAKSTCTRLNMPLLFEKFERDVMEITDFTARLEFADSFYWAIAAIDSSFTPWICKICMGGRINMAIALTLALVGVCMEYNVLDMAGLLTTSMLSNFFFLKKVI